MANKNYLERKAEARQTAIDWQCDFGNHNYSWYELDEYGIYFERIG